MFYRKRIKALENRVDELESKVQELGRKVKSYSRDVEFLMTKYLTDFKPKKQKVKKNGKEDIVVTKDQSQM